MKTLRDTWLIYRRSVVLTLRQPVWVAMGMFQPILYLLLFGPLLEGATGAAGATGSAFNWFVPGLLIMTGFFAAAFAGFGLACGCCARDCKGDRAEQSASASRETLFDITFLRGRLLRWRDADGK